MRKREGKEPCGLQILLTEQKEWIRFRPVQPSVVSAVDTQTQWLLRSMLGGHAGRPLQARGDGRHRHSPLMLHNEPNGVADVSVLLVGAQLHLHAHLLLLALNVL